MINQAIHTIDLLQWMRGGVKAVTGHVQTSVQAIESEDLGVATVEFLNGAIGVIEGTTAVRPGYKERIEIHGEKGSVILEGGHIKEWKVQGLDEADFVDKEKVAYGSTASPAVSHANHKAQLQEIVEAIQEGREPSVTGEEGLKSLRIVLGIYKSSEKRKRVAP